MRELWLEFEEWTDASARGFDPKNAYCNVLLRLDGREYGLNVWTFSYMNEQLSEAASKGERYLLTPDLVVSQLDRSELEEVFDDLIKTGSLEDAWLSPENSRP